MLVHVHGQPVSLAKCTYQTMFINFHVSAHSLPVCFWSDRRFDSLSTTWSSFDSTCSHLSMTVLSTPSLTTCLQVCTRCSNRTVLVFASISTASILFFLYLSPPPTHLFIYLFILHHLCNYPSVTTVIKFFDHTPSLITWRFFKLFIWVVLPVLVQLWAEEDPRGWNVLTECCLPATIKVD